MQSSSNMMRPRPMTEPRLPHSRSTGWVRFSRLGEVKGWGVFPVFYDVLRTFRI